MALFLTLVVVKKDKRKREREREMAFVSTFNQESTHPMNFDLNNDSSNTYKMWALLMFMIRCDR